MANGGPSSAIRSRPNSTLEPGAPDGAAVERVVEHSAASVPDLAAGDVVLIAGKTAVRTGVDFDRALVLSERERKRRPLRLVWSKAIGKRFIAPPMMREADSAAAR